MNVSGVSPTDPLRQMQLDHRAEVARLRSLLSEARDALRFAVAYPNEDHAMLNDLARSIEEEVGRG